jgi:hypothetical protein
VNARRTLIAIVLMACIAAATGLVAGCGSRGAHLPKVTTNVQLGPKSGQVTIGVKSSGSGYGIGQIALTYPSGHLNAQGGGLLMDGIGWSNLYGPLRPGSYKYTLYAVPKKSAPKYPIFPDGARTPQNVVASGTFVVH